MRERCQHRELDQAGIGKVPAVAGLQVLQRRQPCAVLQRGIRQVLVALPAAPQLLHRDPGQALKRTLSLTGYLQGYRLCSCKQGTGRRACKLCNTSPDTEPIDSRCACRALHDLCKRTPCNTCIWTLHRQACI